LTKKLNPLLDGSTYTINIALNKYDCGDCYFLRQKYKNIRQKIGTAMMYLERLTYYDEGLPITSR